MIWGVLNVAHYCYELQRQRHEAHLRERVSWHMWMQCSALPPLQRQELTLEDVCFILMLYADTQISTGVDALPHLRLSVFYTNRKAS